jgi:signal peptidase I
MQEKGQGQVREQGQKEQEKPRGLEKREREKKQSKLKRAFKAFWDFLWYSNSILSWILLILLAFVVVKFVFFPLASLALSSKMPFVIVESYSMQHCNSIRGNVLTHCGFDEYWMYFKDGYEEFNISKEMFQGFSFSNGLDAGDIVITKGKDEYEIGDVIVFFADHRPIIHRIVSKNKNESQTLYATKGDNNFAQLPFEKNIKKEQIVGKAIARIPKLGWIKLLPYKLLGLA